MQQYCCTVDASKLLLHVCIVQSAKFLQHQPSKKIAFKMFEAVTLRALKMFPSSNQNKNFSLIMLQRPSF